MRLRTAISLGGVVRGHPPRALKRRRTWSLVSAAAGGRPGRAVPFSLTCCYASSMHSGWTLHTCIGGPRQTDGRAREPWERWADEPVARALRHSIGLCIRFDCCRFSTSGSGWLPGERSRSSDGSQSFSGARRTRASRTLPRHVDAGEAVLFKLLIRGSSCVKGLYGLCRISERRESRIPEKPAKYWRAQRHTTKVARRNSQGLRPDSSLQSAWATNGGCDDG